MVGIQRSVNDGRVAPGFNDDPSGKVLRGSTCAMERSSRLFIEEESQRVRVSNAIVYKMAPTRRHYMPYT